ncbi:MAG: release factor glutamine methyltransferase [Methylobacteriaceae bacterium]|jgi:methylase of polypeptide subunit release factors|nr:release factor glutamine methyltransferase [Methylobacteriaceae bacterium]
MADMGGTLVRLGKGLHSAGYEFTTTTPASHVRVNARPENKAAKDLRDVFGWSRPFSRDLLPADLVALMHDAGILLEENGMLRSALRVSSLDGRLFFHSAFPTTEADAVFFGPDTYRFARAIEAGLRDRTAPIANAVDIGCGAGSGGVLMAKHAPEARVLMTDINESALRLARVNAALAGAANAITQRSDILAEIDGVFDIIVSNPPYLNDALGRAYRHGGGDLGADLSLRILDAALPRLAPAGTLILYTGSAIVDGRDLFRNAALPRLAAADLAWTYEEVDPDVFGEELETEAYRAADRIAAVVLNVRKRS